MRMAGVVFVVLVFSLLLFIMQLNLLKKIADVELNEDERTCKATVEMRSKIVVNAAPQTPIIRQILERKVPLTPMICKTIEKDLGEKKGEFETKKISKDELKKELSSHIVRCWNEFSEGKYLYTVSLSVEKDIFDVETVENKGDYCFPCYEIGVPQIVDENGNNLESISVNEVIDYMKDEKNKVKGDYTTYDYITKYQGRPGRFAIFTDKIESFNTYRIYYSDSNWQDDQSNGIYLSNLKYTPQTWRTNWLATFTKAGAGTAGAVIGGVGGAIICAPAAAVAGVAGVLATAPVSGAGGVAAAAAIELKCATLGIVGGGLGAYTAAESRIGECETTNCECYVVS